MVESHSQLWVGDARHQSSRELGPELFVSNGNSDGSLLKLAF